MQWPVTLLPGGHPLIVLKQKSGCQKDRHSERRSEQTTLLDIFNGQKEDYAPLRSEGAENFTAVQITCEFDRICICLNER